MHRVMVPIVVVLMVSACSPPVTAAATDSGIEGYVTVGPACPMVQAADPCPDRPYAATLTILAYDGHARVAQTQADSAGYYRVLLAPGQYILHPESPAVYPRGAEVTFAVQAGLFTHQDVVYDSGIR